MPYLRFCICLLLFIAGVHAVVAEEAAPWRAGLAKVDITPTEPLRLGGYGNRTQPSTGIADHLFVRTLVMSQGEQTLALISIDSIGIVASMTRRIEEQLSAKHGLSRSDFVLCSTHSHAAPFVAVGESNMFQAPLTPAELEASQRYARQLEASILRSVELALANRQPARLEIASSTADFAINRRVLNQGIWSGFGVQPNGPIDRRVRVLRVSDHQGKLLGAATMYACHCTSVGPEFNQVSSDWAGLAAQELEAQHAGSVFVPVIGCGADANPEPRTGYADAQRHGRAMAASIQAALAGDRTELVQFPSARFGYAGLAPEIPARADLEAALGEADVFRRRWAERMLATLQQMGRLPETYPQPIHTWSFGKELVWVFLGGEVVVDYQLRLEKDLPAANVWVAAYADDVFAYVSSERMRAEGGYEVDGSMVYYGQPGRWQSGTEDLIARRTQEILSQTTAEDKPRTAEQSWQSIHVPEGYVVDMMAAEPLVNDPVNIAFGHDGRVWVAEMSDYPLGSPEGGRVRWLRDTDGDGTLDQSQVFLDGLNYPSSVTPWRDGVIVITSPAIFFAADRDGDGRAEVREELLQGIAEANPQHRASGFEIGLDGWLNLTSGDDTHELHSTRSGQRTDASRRDLRWNPDTGEFQLTAGHTQFVRARDEFGNWFGNVNNQPMLHYVIEDKYRTRAGFSGPAYKHLTDPPIAPPVLPASRTVDRFNDLATSNRFTSACSSIICRVPGLGPQMQGAALVCEPVHNLIARFHVQADGATFKAVRFEEDTQYDFFASSDPFSRPVRIVNAPDGTLWIADMVRQVIEHPEWIPKAWQSNLNLRSGTGLGRIYRVRRKDYQPQPLPDTSKMTEQQLLTSIVSDNGALRDLAEQQLLWRSNQDTLAKNNASTAKALSAKALSAESIKRLKTLAVSHPLPAVRAQVLGTLSGLRQLDEASLQLALQDKDAHVRRYAASLLDASPKDLMNVIGREEDIGTLVQLALSLGLQDSTTGTPALEAIATHAANDAWLAKALSLVGDNSVSATLTGLIQSLPHLDTATPTVRAAVEGTLASLWSRAGQDQQLSILNRYFSGEQPQLTPVQINLLCALSASGKLQLDQDNPLTAQIAAALRQASAKMLDEESTVQTRRQLLPLILIQDGPVEERLQTLVQLLEAQQPPEIQQTALDTIRRLQADTTGQALMAAWSGLLPDLRSGVLNLLLERRPWAEQLVVALEQGKLKETDLDTAIVQRLRTYGDRKLLTRIEKVLGSPPISDRAQVVKEMMSQLSGTGNIERGLRLFSEHCAICHRAAPDRPIVGAPLENISNWNQEQWVVAILDPSRSIEPKYHQYIVVLADGRSLSGVIEDRSSHHLTLAAADGKRHEIELNQIESLKDLGTSMMPEGLEKKLSPTDMVNLLAYLQTLKNQN